MRLFKDKPVHIDKPYPQRCPYCGESQSSLHGPRVDLARRRLNHRCWWCKGEFSTLFAATGTRSGQVLPNA